jgi:hypothetical protein
VCHEIRSQIPTLIAHHRRKENEKVMGTLQNTKVLPADYKGQLMVATL